MRKFRTLRDLFKSEEDYQNRNKPIPREKFGEYFANNKKEEEQKEKQEQVRISRIKCPSCRSDKKQLYEKRENNGIIGPGYSSWVVESYWICKKCGTHYTK